MLPPLHGSTVRIRKTNASSVLFGILGKTNNHISPGLSGLSSHHNQSKRPGHSHLDEFLLSQDVPTYTSHVSLGMESAPAPSAEGGGGAAAGASNHNNELQCRDDEFDELHDGPNTLEHTATFLGLEGRPRGDEAMALIAIYIHRRKAWPAPKFRRPAAQESHPRPFSPPRPASTDFSSHSLPWL